MGYYGAMEITTQIGCSMRCKYCPQSLLIKRYLQRSKETTMSLETFKKCIDRIPIEVAIHFSGLAEPWLNAACTEMLLYAHEKGHKVAVYSTLVGMTRHDFERIKSIPFASFIIHFPDAQNNSQIPVTGEYLEFLRYVITTLMSTESRQAMGGSCHGELHPEISGVIDLSKFDQSTNGMSHFMVDRAGLLANDELPHTFMDGAIMCGICSRLLNKNVLLPNGDVFLCCMDYGLEYHVGNLLFNTYEEIMTSPTLKKVSQSMENGDPDLMCRRCHNAVAAQASIQYFRPVDLFQKLEASKTDKFAGYLGIMRGATSIVVMKDYATLSLNLHFDPASVFVIQDDFHYLLKFPALLEKIKSLTEAGGSVILEQAMEDDNSLQMVIEKLEYGKIPVEFAGYSSDVNGAKTLIVVARKRVGSLPPSEDFRVIAILAVYNEEDIIVPTISNLISNGVEVYLIDNWSTDRTFELASQFLGKGLIGLERFPVTGPELTYKWVELLGRKQQLSRELRGDWFIHHDADEIREAPWQGVSLRDAIYLVDQEGFNAIDFTTIDFTPVDNNFRPGSSFLDYFRYFEFGKRPDLFLQTKAWKKTEEMVDLASSGGHVAEFAGRRNYPYKFLLRHYPFRSQEHAIKKVLEDRRKRYDHEARRRGWHHQYDHFSEKTQVLKAPQDLELLASDFYEQFLVERLTGVGLMPREIIDLIISKKAADFLVNPQTQSTEPSHYSRAYAFEDYGDRLVYHGYQEFALWHHSIENRETDDYLQQKAKFIEEILSPYLLRNRTLLDLGAASGYFCFYALQHGAEQAIANEIDQNYVGGLRAAKEKFCLDSFNIIDHNFEDISGKYDVVLALAVIHWFYSCTADFGSLDAVVKRLSDLAEYAVIVEWIDPDDPAIQSYDHIHRNPERITGPYDYETFEAALNNHFARFNVVAQVSPTRRIFAAYKTAHVISYEFPFPHLEQGTIVSSQVLTHHEGVPYWSVVYDCGDYYVKQATKDLASREGRILRMLPERAFPKVLSIEESEEYSIVKLSKIDGISIDKVSHTLVENRKDLMSIFFQLLEILHDLQRAGITHREIHATNILVSDKKKIYLIDFGWAVADGYEYFTPDNLSKGPKLPDGTYSDVYSVGQVLKLIGSERFPEIDALVDLMVHPCVNLRIAELNTIEVMLHVINATKSESHEALENAAKNLFSILQRYYEAVREFEMRDQEYSTERQSMVSQLESLSRDAASLNNALNAYTYEYTQIVDSKAWRLVNRLRKIRRQLLPQGSRRDKMARFLWKSLQKIRRKIFRG